MEDGSGDRGKPSLVNRLVPLLLTGGLLVILLWVVMH